MDILDFQLTDSRGNTHEYVMRQHPAAAGLELVDALIAAGLGAIVELLFKSIEIPDNFDELTDVQKADITAAISKGMDREVLVGQALDGLRRAGGLSRLAPLLLKYTHRDGEPLGKDVNFASAYQGNYGEMIAAAKKSIEHNGFFDVFSMSFA